MSRTEELVQVYVKCKQLLEQEREAESDISIESFLADFDLNAEEKKQIYAELFANGPIDLLMADTAISEIMINGDQEIWIEKQGRLQITEHRFLDEKNIRKFMQRSLAEIGRKIDRMHPFADARLADGSRICAAIEPAVMGGDHLCIRRITDRFQKLSCLYENGFCEERQMQFLLDAVATQQNILISGATGSGKTSLLGALVREVSNTERVLSIEDVVELKANHPHFVQLESRPANIEGKGEITIRQLLRSALRMRPDRIILGECRGEEALDLLQALNTGHKGSMATIHANNTRDALARLEFLSLLAKDGLTANSVKNYILSAIDLVIQIERVDGVRKITEISELKGLDESVFLMKKLF